MSASAWLKYLRSRLARGRRAGRHHLAAGPGRAGFRPGLEPLEARDVPAVYAYLSASTEPWGVSTNVDAMNAAFGAGNWDRLQFGTAVAAAAFTPGHYQFVYIDGSAGGTFEFEAFVNANRPLLEAWVSAGGSLFTDSARWGDGNDFNLGFGATLRAGMSGTAAAVNPAHPVFTPATGTSWTGNNFSHEYTVGSLFSPVIWGQPGQAVLSEAGWGAGHVMLGGMTSTYFQNPQPEAFNLRVSILDYAAALGRLDTTPPAVSAPDLDAGSDTGFSAAYDITTAQTLVLNGTAEPGSAVRLWEGTTLLGTTTATAAGTYAFTVAGLAEGRHTYFATATDAAGNRGTSATLTVVVDRTAPAVDAARLDGPNAAGWNNTDVTVVYTAADAGGLPPGAATGSYTFTTEGADQSHTFTVTDLAGNTATAVVGRVSIDKTPPTLTGGPDRPANANGWYDAAVTVGFTAADALSGLVAAPSSQTLGEGAGQSVTRTVTDRAGNSTTLTVAGISVDTTAPAVAVASGPPVVTNDRTAHFDFSAADALSGVDTLVYSLDGGGWVTTTGTTADFASLADGGHTLAVRSVDRAGNSSAEADYAWTVDRATGVSAAPAVGTYGGTTTLSATLTWQADGSALAGRAVAFSVGGAPVGSAVTGADGVAVLSGVSLAGLGVGLFTVEASYAGDTGYAAGGGTATLTVAKADAVVDVSGASVTYDGLGHVLTGTATGVYGEDLSGLLTLGAVYTYAGTYPVGWSFAGNANYNPSAGAAVVVIAKAASVTTVTGGTFTYDGTGHGATAAAVTGAGGLAAAPTLVYTDAAGTVLAGLPTDAGSYTVTASSPGDPNHTGSSAAAVITIARAVPTVTVVGGEFAYNHHAHPAAGSVTGVNGVGLGTPMLTYTYVDASGSLVTLTTAPVDRGVYTVTASYAGSANYAPATATGVLTIGVKGKASTAAVPQYRAGDTVTVQVQLADGGAHRQGPPRTDVAGLVLERVSPDGTRTVVTLRTPDGWHRGQFASGPAFSGFLLKIDTTGLAAGEYVISWQLSGDAAGYAAAFRLT